MADDHPTPDPGKDEYGEVDTGHAAAAQAGKRRAGPKRRIHPREQRRLVVTRPDEPIPEDIDVREPGPGNSDRDEDNEGPFEIDTDKLRVKPDEEE